MNLRAKDHLGMRVDYSGMLRQAREALQMVAPHNNGRLHAEMLRQLQERLKEMGERFYAGDVAVVDEFLQMYCIASDRRAQPVPVDTEAAIQKLAGELPDDYDVTLHVERGAGWVVLNDPEGNAHSIHPDERTMGECLLAALEVAKGAAS